MEIDRRELFRLGAAGMAVLLGRPVAASARAPTALEVHRATRNTLRGAIGARLRRHRGRPGRFKPYPDRPRVSLPEPDFGTGRPLYEALGYRAPAGFSTGDLSVQTLSRLLFLTNGVTDRSGRIALRAAPSAGALYAGEIYVVAERVEGLAAGLYAYHAGHHDLARLRAGHFLPRVASALETPDLLHDASVAVLVTNVFQRYGVRYANRGYRYALIDTGHIAENLRLAAWELDLAESTLQRFEDERLEALLGVDGLEEALCSVHGIGAAGSAPASTSPRSRLVERGASGEASPGLPPPERYHRATKLVRSKQPASGNGGGPAQPTPAGTTPPVPTRTAVHEAIRVRRSTSRFEARPMPRSALLQILALARGHAPLFRAAELDLYCVAHRVESQAPGLYRYDPVARELQSRRREDLAEALVAACLGQRKSGEAAAAVIGVARLAEATARGGERAYRDLLIDAGATAERLYLGAEALGYTARNLAAYYDDPLDALLGLDGKREVAVHLTALGSGD